MKHLSEYINEANIDKEVVNMKATSVVEKWSTAMKDSKFRQDLKNNIFEHFEKEIQSSGEYVSDSDGDTQREEFEWSNNLDIEEMHVKWKGDTCIYSAYTEKRTDKYTEIQLHLPESIMDNPKIDDAVEDQLWLKTSNVKGAKKLNSILSSFITKYVEEIVNNDEKIFNDEY